MHADRKWLSQFVKEAKEFNGHTFFYCDAGLPFDVFYKTRERVRHQRERGLGSLVSSGIGWVWLSVFRNWGQSTLYTEVHPDALRW